MALNAVTSFSRESGIGDVNGDMIGVITVDSIQGLVLVIKYSWPANLEDLDTATVFLGSTVGFGCQDSSTYVQWTGDDLSYGGTEVGLEDDNDNGFPEEACKEVLRDSAALST